MLTRQASRFREYALFALAALAPALAVGLLALRALSNETAAALRETAAGLDAASERLSLGTHQALSRSEKKLGANSLDRPTPDLAHTLDALRPAFATAVVLGADRALLWPAPPRAATHPAPAKCDALAATLSDPSAAGRAEARARLLLDCQELRSPTGRWLWPVVALDAGSGESASRIAGWLEQHTGLLSNAQREAIRLKLDQLPTPARLRASAALSRDNSARAALSDELADPAVARALSAAPDSSGVVTWRAGSTLGALRPLDDGRLAGFVVDAGSLELAIDRGALGAGTERRVRVARGTAPPASGHALPSRLSVRVELAPDLALVVQPADADVVARHAARSRLLLIALALGSTLIAFGVAALLFARMRAARRSSELRTDFVSAVSHELRTPIASVRMFAELLEENRVAPEERHEVIDAIARESRRLGETVERLLGFSRMAAGRAVVDRQVGSVADAVAAAIDTFEQRHPDLPPIERALDAELRAPIDAAQIGLAIGNLLENAKKYAPNGTPYRVEVARERQGVAIRVRDHGPGIAPRDQKRIFRPFERADDRLSRATEGSGIGLSLVRHVAGAHGGSASVDSRPGKGATFTLWVPGSET